MVDWSQYQVVLIAGLCCNMIISVISSLRKMTCVKHIDSVIYKSARFILCFPLDCFAMYKVSSIYKAPSIKPRSQLCMSGHMCTSLVYEPLYIAKNLFN